MRWDKKAALAVLLTAAFSVAASGQKSSEVLVYGKKYVMGTVFEIAAYDHSYEHGSDAIERALAEVVRIDDILSNFKPESPLSELNRSAHFHSERVSPDLYRVIERALQLSRLTDGKFDISVAPLVDLWKAALSGDAIPSAEQESEVRGCVGYKKIELTPPDQITFHSPCLRLDLGAVGKGYAVDRAADVLRKWDINDALINAGGSTLLAMGSPPGKSGWLLHLRDPSDKLDPQVMLRDQSVSTSEQTPPSLLGKNSAGHIIDPDTGMPLPTDFAVSVVAKTGSTTDGLSTSLLLLGPERGRVLVSHLQEVSAIWISPRAETEIINGGPQIRFGGERPATRAGNTP